jgi:hypothetical protein
MKHSDEIFRIDQGSCQALPSRSMKQGLLGKSLEDALQTLLEEHPNLIPGKQIAPSSELPPQFVLLRREMPISGWSIDHLFVDQYSVPTLVEAKLIQNPEARREVIGQIIEYAANASDLWSAGRARSFAEEYYRNNNRKLDETLLHAYGSELDIDVFWQTFDQNLQEGRVRLIIAADQIQPGVRRMIEYLNVEMRNAEVFGLELTCYGNDEHSLVIVPRIIGQTQATADRKSEREKSTNWSAALIESTLASMDSSLLINRLLEVLRWAVAHGTFIAANSKNLAFNVANRHGKRLISFNIDGGGYICLAGFYFNENIEERNLFFNGMKEIGMLEPYVAIEDVKDGRYYAAWLDQLKEDEFSKLLQIMESLN